MSEEWIKNLKVGDKVIVAKGGYGIRKVGKVERITPSGFVCVSGYLYKKDGTVRGDNWSWLEEATKEAMTKIMQDKKIKECFSMMQDTQKISYSQAVAIIRILEEETK